MDWKTFLKNFWHFLWDDNSVWSWLANVIVAFILIKFIVYPLLSLLFATSHPVVAVISGSMEHQGKDFETWWTEPDACCSQSTCFSRQQMYEQLNISQDTFEEYWFRNGFNKGDIMVLSGWTAYEKGDVLVFSTAALYEPIIHRIVKIDARGTDPLFTTKGDNNCISMPSEKLIGKERVIGKAVLRIPYLGWIKIGFVSFIQMVRGVVG